MKRPKLKKASKRISCSKRYKIQKKVREHHRKLKKEAKKKGVQKRVKKDPGVPNSAPFKEEVLREAEQRRLKIEEEKEKQRQAKIEERAQKRKKEKEAASKETEPKAKKARTDKVREKRTASNKNSKQFLCAELNKVINESDVVIEVLDARDPLGSRCPQVEETVLHGGGNKKLLLVLNKIDLVPKEILERWIEFLQKELPVVAFKASTRMREKTVPAKKSKVVPSNEVLDKSKGATCLGNVCLTNMLTSYASKTQNEAMLKVGVVGFPNVGKSSLINSLKGMMVCHVGSDRGTTKTMQLVHISKNIKVMDSPGIVASPSNPPVSIALWSLQVEEGDLSVLDAVGTLLKQCNKNQIMLQYNVPDFKNFLEFLTLFAKKRGFLQKGGVPNTEQAAVTFLSDWTGAKLSFHSLVPPDYSLPTYMSEGVVTDMFDGWDLNKLNNEETIKGYKFPNQASSMSFISKGPTAGLLSVSEESPGAAEEKVEQNENNEPEQTVDSCEGEELKKPQEKSLKEKPSKVKFQSAPIDISLSTVNTDDAYDFNTDFI